MGAEQNWDSPSPFIWSKHSSKDGNQASVTTGPVSSIILWNKLGTLTPFPATIIVLLGMFHFSNCIPWDLIRSILPTSPCELCLVRLELHSNIHTWTKYGPNSLICYTNAAHRQHKKAAKKDSGRKV